MERALEERIQFALSKMVDPDQFLVIVKVEPYTAEELKAKFKAEGGKGGEAAQDVLPGIPQRQSIDKLSPEKADAVDLFWQSKPFIKRLSVTLFLDKQVNQDLSQQIEILVKQLVDFDPARQDELRVSRMAARQTGARQTGEAKGAIQHIKFTMDQIKDRKDFYWIVMGGVVTAGIMVFMFGPLMFFLFKFSRIFQNTFSVETPESATGVGGRISGESGGGVGAAPSPIGGKLELASSTPIVFSMETKGTGPSFEIFLGEPEKQPYSFINEKDVVNILLLMKEEPPLHLAIVAYHLRPDLAAALISGLDGVTRKQVVEHLAAPQVLMRDEVKSLGQSLKQRVRGIIYGVDQYFAIYDSASPGAQTELLRALESQTPALVDKMRSEMFSFEDLMALDSSALRVVFREVALRTLATALMGTSVTMRDRILGVLPSGASEIIRQEIEMNPAQNQRAIDEERKKIVAVVRRLVWDKKIVVPPRQKGTRSPAAVPA